MRWFLRSTAIVALGWLFFAASPYLAAYDLARAVATGDAALLRQRVNFRALRVSLSRELLDAYLVETDTDGRITASERQIGAGVVASLGETIMGSIATPEGLIALLRRRAAGAPEGDGSSSGAVLPWSDILALVSRSQTRGFRTVYFVLPPKAGADQRFRVQLRLSRFEWRLVNLELPPALKHQLAQDIAARLTSEGTR